MESVSYATGDGISCAALFAPFRQDKTMCMSHSMQYTLGRFGVCCIRSVRNDVSKWRNIVNSNESNCSIHTHLVCLWTRAAAAVLLFFGSKKASSIVFKHRHIQCDTDSVTEKRHIGALNARALIWFIFSVHTLHYYLFFVLSGRRGMRPKNAEPKRCWRYFLLLRTEMEKWKNWRRDVTTRIQQTCERSSDSVQTK